MSAGHMGRKEAQGRRAQPGSHRAMETSPTARNPSPSDVHPCRSPSLSDGGGSRQSGHARHWQRGARRGECSAASDEEATALVACAKRCSCRYRCTVNP